MLRLPRWKIWLSLLVCGLGMILAAPNLWHSASVASWPSFMPRDQVNLGLDLQGGAHLVLRVETNSAFQERMQGLVDGLRGQLRRAHVGYLNLATMMSPEHKMMIVLRLREPNQLEELKKNVAQLDPDLVVEAGDEGQIRLFYPEMIRDLQQKGLVDQVREIIRRRIDETGTREPVIQRQGADRILLQLPGIQDPERVKQLLGQTAKLAFRLVDTSHSDETLTPQTPVGPALEVLPGEDRNGAEGNDHAPSYYAVKREVMVGGDSLVDAQPGFDENGRAVVNFRFDSMGGRKFGQVTQENVGRVFAIVLDNKVICAPVIREAITGGSGMISGNFTTQQAQDLALLLRAGALPCPLTILEERTVGPGLGSDSIKMGQEGTIISIGLVVLFMLVAYGLFGLFATVGVFFNIVLLFAAMTVLQITLTLPGIAGIALTIGMAVDANVLIYERIREELRQGQRAVVAIDSGFKRALSTIVDSNLTTLIANLLLYQFGTGPVRGFALTLSLGILISMFTAVTLTQVVVAWWFNWRRPKELIF